MIYFSRIYFFVFVVDGGGSTARLDCYIWFVSTIEKLLTESHKRPIQEKGKTKILIESGN